MTGICDPAIDSSFAARERGSDYAEYQSEDQKDEGSDVAGAPGLLKPRHEGPASHDGEQQTDIAYRATRREFHTIASALGSVLKIATAHEGVFPGAAQRRTRWYAASRPPPSPPPAPEARSPTC